MGSPLQPRFSTLVLHLARHLQGLLGLRALLEGAAGQAAADDIRLDPLVLQLAQPLQGLLRLCALLEGADRRAAADDIRLVNNAAY